MLCNKNCVVVASAGSRKTTQVVQNALRARPGRVLITTYTNENVSQIKAYLREHNGCSPPHVDVMSWYSFLLHHGVRPYQNQLSAIPRVVSILFDELPEAARYQKRASVDAYYFTAKHNIYRDRVADFVCECNARTGGLVVKRLERIYSYIFLDELQDMSGYDLSLLEALFNSSIYITAVGDPRQTTYTTNNSAKNKQYRRNSILDWVLAKSRSKLVRIEERVECYRSNQTICDFADALYPELPKTTSMSRSVSGHDGVFSIDPELVPAYVQKFTPTVLRYNRRANTMGYSALNIGVAKGRTFDRVLIFPTEPMKTYLQSGKPADAGDISKLYVAVTRARFSVAFVVKKNFNCPLLTPCAFINE